MVASLTQKQRLCIPLVAILLQGYMYLVMPSLNETSFFTIYCMCNVKHLHCMYTIGLFDCNQSC